MQQFKKSFRQNELPSKCCNVTDGYDALCIFRISSRASSTETENKTTHLSRQEGKLYSSATFSFFFPSFKFSVYMDCCIWLNLLLLGRHANKDASQQHKDKIRFCSTTWGELFNFAVVASWTLRFSANNNEKLVAFLVPHAMFDMPNWLY